MTEKNYNPEQKQMKTMKKQETAEQKVEGAPVKKGKQEEKKETAKDKKETKGKQKPKIKKNEAIVNGISVPISTKTSAAICKFIKRKTIPKAIADLEEVLKFKRAIPMKGEIPHRKGKIMAGRYPIYAVEHFIKLLKSLSANANMNELEEPIITEAVANKASQPYGRSGAIKRKRTHIKIKVMEKKLISKKKNKQ